jgi:hypothetical protein
MLITSSKNGGFDVSLFIVMCNRVQVFILQALLSVPESFRQFKERSRKVYEKWYFDGAVQLCGNYVGRQNLLKSRLMFPSRIKGMANITLYSSYYSHITTLHFHKTAIENAKERFPNSSDCVCV